MIKVSCKYGKFTLDNGKFIEGEDKFKRVFQLADHVSFTPQEGPIDYAIANFMINSLDKEWKIEASDFPTEEGVVD